jgi:phosphatidylglycerophosphatase A
LNVNQVSTRDYAKKDTWWNGTNKPNSNPNKPNFTPLRDKTNPIQTQYKPKQTQFHLRPATLSLNSYNRNFIFRKPARTTDKKGLIVFDLIEIVSYPSANMKKMLTSCFGLGWLPLAPGTWGSLPPAIIFAAMCQFGAPAVSISITMAALTVSGSVICVKFAPAAIAATGKADPREVVADEFAGQALTFLAVPFLFPLEITTWQICITTALGFLLFRVFDILKPLPIRKLEKLPNGWGILADDLLAAVYAAIVLMLCLRLWIAKTGT